MTEADARDFQVGDRVRVVADLPMARVGEEGRVTALHHDESACLRSLTVLIDHDAATTRGITVLPREIVAAQRRVE